VITRATAAPPGYINITLNASLIARRSHSSKVECPICGSMFGQGRGLRMHLQSKRHNLTKSDLANVMRTAEAASVLAPPLEGPVAASTTSSSVRGKVETSSSLGLDQGLEAARDGRLDVLEGMVASGWNASCVRDRHGASALDWAAGSGRLAVCKYLVDTLRMPPDEKCATGRADGRSALHWAARNGRLEVCRWLVETQAVDVDLKTNDGTTPLHWAVWQAHLSTANWLLEAKADAFAVNDYGCTAIHWASLSGDLTVCKWLDKLGLDFFHANSQGHTALHKAAWKNQKEVLKWILRDKPRAKSQCAMPDKNGYNPADIAKLAGHDELASWLSLTVNDQLALREGRNSLN